MLRQQSVVGGGVLLGLLALAAPSRADEAAAAKLLEELGGRVTLEDGLPAKPIVSVDLSAAEVSDEALKTLKQLKNLRALDLGTRQATDASLKELTTLRNLQSLSLSGSN